MKEKNSISSIILAAGKGSRLKISTPKPLLDFCGKKMIDYPLNFSQKLFKRLNINGNISFIVNHQKELIINYITENYNKKNNFIFVDQGNPLGTGHAIQQYFKEVEDHRIGDYIIVTCADTPLIDEGVFEKIYKEIILNKLDAVVASFKLDNPFGYGRIDKSSKNGFVIVEEKDASSVQKKISEVNSGLYIFKKSFLQSQIQQITNQNKSKEYYLTDVFSYEAKTKSYLFNNELLFRGVNTLSQLEEIELIKRKDIIKKHQNNGVRFIDSNNVYIDSDVVISEDVVIFPNVHLRGKTMIGAGVTIDTGTIIIDSVIENNVIIKAYCHFEETKIDSKSIIGPYARLRPGSKLAKECKVGNFVEIKKSSLSKGTKVSHLSYIGDAQIGENTNIGCGFITCNYDGKNKHKTVIGKDCFIGSDTQVIAPIEIGSDCFVASGSTINNNMPDGSFAISRSKQITKNDLAKKFIKK